MNLQQLVFAPLWKKNQLLHLDYLYRFPFYNFAKNS